MEIVIVAAIIIMLCGAGVVLHVVSTPVGQRWGLVLGGLGAFGGTGIGLVGGPGIAASGMVLFGVIGYVVGALFGNAYNRYKQQSLSSTIPSPVQAPPALSHHELEALRAAEKVQAKAREDQARAASIALSYQERVAREASWGGRTKKILGQLALVGAGLALGIVLASRYFSSPAPATTAPATRTAPPVEQGQESKSASQADTNSSKPRSADASAAKSKVADASTRVPADCEGRILVTEKEKLGCGGRKMWSE